MRLPSLDELNEDDERSLREHDVVELHSETSSVQATTYRRRLEVIVELFERWASPGVVLDAACAQGNVAITLAEAGYAAVGIDLRPNFLGYARKKDHQHAAHWVAGSLEALPLQPASISCIVLGEVLEHVAHPERLLEQAAEVLSPRGIVIASTPNGDRLHTGLPHLADIPNRAVLEDRQFQPDADGHLFLMTRGELILAGTSADLELVEHRYIQTPLLTGWPRMQAHVGRIPMPLRQRLNRLGEATRLGRLVTNGQVAVFRKAG